MTHSDTRKLFFNVTALNSNVYAYITSVEKLFDVSQIGF